MVRLNTQVRKCTCNDGEYVKEFIESFKSPPLDYLSLTRYGKESSESQIIAMTLMIKSQFDKKDLLQYPEHSN